MADASCGYVLCDSERVFGGRELSTSKAGRVTVCMCVHAIIPQTL